jgi:hypothetical protein
MGSAEGTWRRFSRIEVRATGIQRISIQRQIELSGNLASIDQVKVFHLKLPVLSSMQTSISEKKSMPERFWSSWMIASSNSPAIERRAP